MSGNENLVGSEDGNEGVEEVAVFPAKPVGRGLVGLAEGDPIAKAMRNPSLPYFEEKAYRLKQTGHAEANLVSRLFGGSVDEATTTVVQYACRWREEEIDGKKTRVGVIIQLVAGAMNFSTDIELSLPVIAASGQLQLTEAKVAIFVAGYSGPIQGNMNVTDFNVENYGKFMEAFDTLKMAILNARPEDGVIYPVPFKVPEG